MHHNSWPWYILFRFPRPGRQSPDLEVLTRFLASEFSSIGLRFTSRVEPNEEAPLAANEIPVEGSGGEFGIPFHGSIKSCIANNGHVGHVEILIHFFC